MGAIGQYINVRTTATGEVRQVNLYSSLDDVGGEGKEFAYGGAACWAAVSEDASHENKSNWAYKAANGAVMQVLTHWEEAVVEFNMYNWAWANYEAATGEDHTALTSFDNTSALPNSAQLRGVTNAANAFFNCRNLTDVSPFAKVAAYGDSVNFSRMFQMCYNLNDISPLSGWNVENMASMWYMFASCSNIATLDALVGWNVAKVTNMTYAFWNCQNLATLDGIANWNVANVTSMADTFRNCFNLASLEPLAGWNVAKVTSMVNTFYYCNRLTTLDSIANWDTGNVTNMYQTFRNCSNLAAPDLASWNTGNVTNMVNTFANCFNLTGVTLPDSLASSVNCSMVNAFINCTNLRGDIWFYGNNVNNATQCFNGCSAYAKNIHAHAGSMTYNSFYSAMGNSTHNDLWNATLVEI